MLNKSSLVKAAFCTTVVLGAFGWGESAYAVQYIYNAKITELNCRGKTCIIKTTAGTNHAITTDTQSCRRGIFGWNIHANSNISRTLFNAYISQTPISFSYSEYSCYSGGAEGFGTPMMFVNFNVR
jgi:hypothetical protein